MYEVRVNGLPSGSQAIRVEGQDSTNGFMQNASQAIQQSVDAIQEVSIQTSNFAAEYGQVGGGYINFTMKSGTNQFHGSAYDYFQNADLNAGLPFTINANGTGLVRNPLNRNDYGFTLGGPVSIPKLYNGKDKTFFFFNFEQFRQSVTTTNLIATAPMPQWTGADPRGANFGPTLANGQPNPGNIENPLGPFLTAGFGTPSPTGQVDSDRRVVRPNHRPLCERRRARFRDRRRPVPEQHYSVQQDGCVVAPLSVAVHQAHSGRAGEQLRSAGLLQLPAHHHSLVQDRSEPQLENKNIRILFRRRDTYSPNANGFAEELSPATPQNTRAQTIRGNFDDTLTPTLLLHVGVGLLYFNADQYPPSFNAGQTLGWGPNQQFPANNIMPQVSGLSQLL